MIFSSENIGIYINENINRVLLWFTFFYNFDEFETPLISLINSIVVVVCWMLVAERIIFLVNLDDVMWWLVNWRDASFTTVSVTLQFTICKLLSLKIIICILWCYPRLNKTSDVWNFEMYKNIINIEHCSQQQASKLSASLPFRPIPLLLS